MAEPGSLPARGYSWPPFGAANDAAVTHGAYSERKVHPIAAELAAGVVVLFPDVADQRHAFAVRAWARAEARVALLEDWLVGRDLVDGDGEPLGAVTLLLRAEKVAADLRARLGLDPKSHAELARSRAEAHRSIEDLDAVRAAGRQAIEAKEADGG